MRLRADNRKIKLAMAKACVNIKELSIKAVLPVQTINNALAEYCISPKTLGKLAKGLNVDPEELIKTEE